MLHIRSCKLLLCQMTKSMCGFGNASCCRSRNVNQQVCWLGAWGFCSHSARPVVVYGKPVATVAPTQWYHENNTAVQTRVQHPVNLVN